MKKCLLYGNCQMGIVHKIFLQIFLRSEYDLTYINCNYSEHNNIENIDISIFDVIITQSVYEQAEYNNTLGVLKKKKKDCVVIVIHSFYFRFYFLNETFFEIKNDRLHLPMHYHDKNLIDLYLKYDKDKNSIVKRYEEIVLSSNFYSEDMYLAVYKNNIKNLKQRFENFSNLYKDFHPIYFIPITDFIEKNYQDNLLWHSNIHPKYNPVLNFVCIEILSILNKDSNLPTDLNNSGYEDQLPVYQSISSLVNFNTMQYITAKVNAKLLNIEDFVDTYLKVYNDEKNAKYINGYKSI
jgi:hypothetical protein